MVRKYTLVDIILMVESFESMNVFSGRTNRALSGTSQNDDGTVGRTNRQRKKSNQVATSLTLRGRQLVVEDCDSWFKTGFQILLEAIQLSDFCFCREKSLPTQSL